MKRILISIFLLLLIYSSNIYSQYDPKPKTTKPSPDALSIGKFGEVPVDLFTGRVNINIPIYVLKEYDIEVPISISYHGGGIKVNEEAEPVGLGWTLNVGGVISRTMCGMPDELNSNQAVGYDYMNNEISGHETYNNRKEFVDVIKNRILDYNPIEKYRFNPNNSDCFLGYLSGIYGSQYDEGHFDTAQDTYTFNFMGISGVFVFDKMKNCIIQSNDGVSINYNKNNGCFEAIDANGYTYKFESLEFQTYRYRANYSWTVQAWHELPEYTFKYPASWWLSSITSPTGETAIFNYSKKENVTCLDLDNSHGIVYQEKEIFSYYQENNSETPVIVYEDSIKTITAFYNPVYGKTFQTIKVQKYISPLYNNQILDKLTLTSIETKNCKVNLEYDNTNCLPIFKQASVLFNKYQDIIDRKVELYQTNFITTENTTRLRLDSIRELGGDSTIARSYKFSYLDKDNYNNNIVPPKSSIQRDHWGFWAPNGGKFPSPVNYFGSFNYVNGNVYKTADELGAKSAMLSSITYPTGGRVELKWEPNTFSSLGLAAQKSAASDNSFDDELAMYMDTTRYSVRLCGAEQYKIDNVSLNVPVSQSIKIDLSNYYSKSFFPEDNYDGYSWSRCISGWAYSDTSDYAMKYPYIQIICPDGRKDYIRIYKNNIKMGVVDFYASKTGTYTFNLFNAGNELGYCNDALCQQFYSIFNGTDCSTCGEVNISCFKFNSVMRDSYITGGARIQRIVNYSGNDTITKLYNYSLDGVDPNSPSSGVLTYTPRYGSLIAKAYNLSDGAPSLWEKETSLITLNSNGLPATLNGGSHIEYSSVSEMIVRNQYYNQPGNPARGDNRYIKYIYWTSKDESCEDVDDTNYGTIVPTDMLKLTSKNYKRGHLKSKLEYTDEWKITNYKYDIIESEIQDIITGSLFTAADFTEMPYLNQCNSYGDVRPYKDLGIVKYRVIPYNKRLIEMQDSGSVTKNYQKYTYANTTYSSNKLVNSPLSSSTIDSEGDTITQYFTYTSLNKIHTCVTVKKGKVIDAFRNEYNSLGQITDRYIAQLNSFQLPLASTYNLGLLQFITNSHPIYGLTNKLIETYQYDRNRLVQVTDQRTQFSTVYLWSYNGTYPIAEIRNSTFSVITNSLGGSQIINNLFSSLTPDINIVNNLRQVLPQCQITTMSFKLAVGMTAFIDPRGVKTTYEYDNFGNLKNMRDNRNKLLKTINYHYIGEYL